MAIGLAVVASICILAATIGATQQLAKVLLSKRQLTASARGEAVAGVYWYLLGGAAALRLLGAALGNSPTQWAADIATFGVAAAGLVWWVRRRRLARTDCSR